MMENQEVGEETKTVYVSQEQHQQPATQLDTQLENELDTELYESEESETEEHNKKEEDEYDTIDVTDNPLYQVLSVLFENEEGKNIVDMLGEFKKSLDTHNELLRKLLLKKKRTSRE